MIDLPWKLRRHIGRFLRFAIVLAFVEFGLQFTAILGLIERGWPYEIGLALLYILGAVWFVWRFYTGMVRDGDFLEDW